MAKKSKNNNLLLVLFIISIITIVYLIAQLQEKDNKLTQLTKEPGFVQATVKKTDVNQEKVKKIIHEKFSDIIKEKPTMGGKWFIDKINFIEEDIVSIEYEDGHKLGKITLKVNNTNDYKSWSVMEKK